MSLPRIQAWARLDAAARVRLLQRPRPEANRERGERVATIVADVSARGDSALFDYTRQLDGVRLDTLEVPAAARRQALAALPDELAAALRDAAARIETFHAAGRPADYAAETAPGVTCRALHRPIRRVGLYVPAGSAPLPSTVLMLTIPARLAGCAEIVLCSPPGDDGECDPTVLAAAELTGVDRVFRAGGAQAVAAMAFGTESVPRCHKLFGPGNAWVTAAKQQVSTDPDGAAIDMPAGPSELMVIADASCEPGWVAADLLSQAEHGTDSQVLLVAVNEAVAAAVRGEVEHQLANLPRREIAAQALAESRFIVAGDLSEATGIANDYAPEHLIIASDAAEQCLESIHSAGSVFLGHYTPESLGDYCSGTNHVLPTGGWARSHSGLSVTDFMRRMTVQQATRQGLAAIGPTAACIAGHERLDAHARAVTQRIEAKS